MARKRKRKGKADWAEAKRAGRLSAEDVRMAKELGMTPRSILKNIPKKSELWKAPVRDWIRGLHAKRFGRGIDEEYPLPDEDAGGDVHDEGDDVSREDMVPPDDIPGPPCDEEDEEDEQEQYARRHQRQYLRAASYVAEALGRVPGVEKVVLFGSCARPIELKRIYSRRKRRSYVMWHQCHDVDLAVWVSDLSQLREFQRARSGALAELLRRERIGVAHHQVEVFVMEPGTDRYLGRLCTFSTCPRGKIECLAAGCGDTPLLQRHEHFVLDPQVLLPVRSQILFERGEAEAVDDFGDIPF